MGLCTFGNRCPLNSQFEMTWLQIGIDDCSCRNGAAPVLKLCDASSGSVHSNFQWKITARISVAYILLTLLSHSVTYYWHILNYIVTKEHRTFQAGCSPKLRKCQPRTKLDVCTIKRADYCLVVTLRGIIIYEPRDEARHHSIFGVVRILRPNSKWIRDLTMT